MSSKQPNTATATGSGADPAATAAVTVEDLTKEELSKLLLTKLTDATDIWGATRKELLDIAAQCEISTLSREDLQEVWPLGRPTAREAAVNKRRAKAFEEQLTERYTRHRIARDATRSTLPSKFLLTQLFVLTVLSLCKRQYGSLSAAKQATVQWLGFAPPPPPPCPKPNWLQRVTPWLKHGRPGECTP